MKVFLIRHGESLANIGLASSFMANDQNNTLTNQGKKQIQELAKSMTADIAALYSSPMYRTIESVKEFSKQSNSRPHLAVDDRLREIDYGIYTDCRDHPEMEKIAKRQIAGDYEVRFGGGENKREIITRFFSFLLDCYKQYAHHNIVLFSHGRAISMVESEFCQITHTHKQHIHTDNGMIKELNIDDKAIKDIKQRIKELNKNGS